MLEQILGDSRPFLDALARQLARQGLPLDLGPMDHVCYRAESNDQYLELRRALAAAGEVLVEGMIGGRPIITFRLHRPLASPFGPVPCLELAAPKPGKAHLAGLEHGEIVVNSLEQLLNDYPGVPFDSKGLARHPPELTLALPPYQLKFHLQSLADTIAAEIARHEVVPVPADYFRR
ncbi:VOC family protein [Zobellella sp. An-6]|uniref:VOC family protein n=1 Tax=Zobellella sp. An-6 TaxID=3400218 RepID=UPI004041EDEE